jgi:hypothetical protein
VAEVAALDIELPPAVGIAEFTGHLAGDSTRLRLDQIYPPDAGSMSDTKETPA